MELYKMDDQDGLIFAGDDDDGGAEPGYSLLREYLETGTYYLRVWSFFGLPGSSLVKRARKRGLADLTGPEQDDCGQLAEVSLNQFPVSSAWGYPSSTRS